MLPNQNNKLSSRSIVRAMPKIEVEIEMPEDELEDETEGMESDDLMPEVEMEKHGTHDQSTHGGGRKKVPTASASSSRQGMPTREQRYEIEMEMDGYRNDLKEYDSERDQLTRQIDRLKGQARMATKPSVRARAKAEIPKLENRRGQVFQNINDTKRELEKLQIELDELRFRT